MRWRGDGADWRGVSSMNGAQVWAFVPSWPNSALLCLFWLIWPSNFYFYLSFGGLLYRSAEVCWRHWQWGTITIPSFTDVLALSVNAKGVMSTIRLLHSIIHCHCWMVSVECGQSLLMSFVATCCECHSPFTHCQYYMHHYWSGGGTFVLWARLPSSTI